MAHLKENGYGSLHKENGFQQPLTQAISNHDVNGPSKSEDGNSSHSSHLDSHGEINEKLITRTEDGGSTKPGDDSDGGEVLNDKPGAPAYSGFEVDPYAWLPPEPADKGDDIEKVDFDDDDDDIYGGDGTKWGQPSFSTSVDELQSKDNLKEERERAMLEAMNGQFKILVSRFLASENICFAKDEESESWLETVVALSWEAALLIRPDASQGKDMDPGSYVKIKCVASGKRQDSQVVKGLVFKKNTAHKHMPTKYQNPRLLLLKGVLGHSDIGLSSLNSMEQEKGYLEKAINKMIDVCSPNVILVEKTVSRDIQELLERAKVTLVLDMKSNRLERISRCMGSPMLSFSDVLSNPKLKQCESFRIERFVEEHNISVDAGKKPAPSKTLMFLEGFPRPLGCTILLHGASTDELKKVKRVMQYTVYAAYHLILETSFFEDQRVFLNSRHCGVDSVVNKQQITTAVDLISSENGEKANSLHNDNAAIESNSSILEGPSQDETYSIELPAAASHPEESNEATKPVINGSIEHDSPSQFESEKLYSSFRKFLAVHGYYFPMLHQHNSYIPFTHEAPDRLEEEPQDGSVTIKKVEEIPNASEIIDHTDENLKLGHDEIVDETKLSNSMASDKLEELSVHATNIEDVSTDTMDKEKLNHNNDIDSVLDTQSILILMSSRCITKQNLCVPSHLSRIKYYGNFDVSLGRYLQDIFHNQNMNCSSCGEPQEAHEYSYTHKNGSLTVRIRQLPVEHKLSGESEGKIWMWTWCLKCREENGSAALTPRIVISIAARNLSFGKFLELSFASHSSARKLSKCGHLLHRDCLRFFGVGTKVAIFRYSPVEIYATCKPPLMLDFYNKNNHELYKQEVLARGKQLFSEVESVLQQFKDNYPASVLVDSSDSGNDNVKGLAEVEKILMQEKSGFEDSLDNLRNNGINMDTSAHYFLSLNWLYQELLLQLYLWDNCLHQLLLDENSEKKNIVLSTAHTIDKIDNSILSSETMDSSSSCDIQCNEEIPAVDSTGSFGSKCKPDSGSGLDDGFEINNGMNRVCGTVGNPMDVVLPCSTADNKDESDTSVFVTDGIQSDGSGQSSGELALSSMDDQENKKNEVVRGKEKNAVIINEQLGGTQECGSTKTGSQRSIWTSFVDAFLEYKNTLGSLQKFDLINKYIPMHLSPLHAKFFSDAEGMQFTIGPNGNILTVSEEEISSIISYSLVILEDQRLWTDNMLGNEIGNGKGERIKGMEKSYSMTSEYSYWSSTGSSDSESSFSRAMSADELSTAFDSSALLASQDLHPEIYVNRKVALKDKYTVICIFAKQFHNLRKKCCPSELSYIASLSHCIKWDAKGGKSKGFFAKTLDDRLIIKQIKKTELDSFLTFGPDYFKHVSYSLDTGNQTCLAKILGIYQVRQVKNGREMKTDLMVMENLLFGHNISRTYDLKGAVFSRHVNESQTTDAVYLDQNFIEDMRVSPIYLAGRTKQLLQRAIWNDTSFLTSINVMDYSLLVGVDKESHQLVFGIIDYLRQYTWDKQLETWVKSSLVVPKNVSPTVISPIEYKKRFRRFMGRNFLAVPDTWSLEDASPEETSSHGNYDQTKVLENKSFEHSIEAYA